MSGDLPPRPTVPSVREGLAGGEGLDADVRG